MRSCCGEKEGRTLPTADLWFLRLLIGQASFERTLALVLVLKSTDSFVTSSCGKGCTFRVEPVLFRASQYDSSIHVSIFVWVTRDAQVVLFVIPTIQASVPCCRPFSATSGTKVLKQVLADRACMCIIMAGSANPFVHLSICMNTQRTDVLPIKYSNKSTIEAPQNRTSTQPPGSR